MVPIRSHLARHVPDAPLDEDDLEARRRRAWREAGIAVVKPAELRSEWLARGIEAWANERYGRRIGEGKRHG